MLAPIKRKIKKYLYYLTWSPKKRLEFVSFTIIFFSLFFGIYFSARTFPFKTLGNITVMHDFKKISLINSISHKKNELFANAEVYRFDMSNIEKYALDTLDDLTTDELIYVKGELEKDVKLDPQLPRYPGSTPPPPIPKEVEPTPQPDPTPEPEPQPEPQPEEPFEPPPTREPEEIAKEILEYINIERNNVGVSQLTMNFALVNIAQNHSQDMKERNYFSHTTPEGVTFPQRLSKVGFSSGGENLYYSGRNNFNGDEPVISWMKSPGHRNNMLYSLFNRVGIGVSGAYVTADFIP